MPPSTQIQDLFRGLFFVDNPNLTAKIKV